MEDISKNVRIFKKFGYDLLEIHEDGFEKYYKYLDKNTIVDLFYKPDSKIYGYIVTCKTGEDLSTSYKEIIEEDIKQIENILKEDL